VPIKTSKSEPLLSANQVHKYTRRLLSKYPNMEIKTLKGLDLYDRRIGNSDHLLWSSDPSLNLYVNDRLPEVSIVIPSFNGRETIKYCLHEVAKQDLSSHRFEVLIIDDGSSDNTNEIINEFVSENEIKFNLKYYYLPRKKKRHPGDFSFRAGLVRNFGATKAQGKHLLFLDADILLPPSYLKTILKLSQHYDVIQPGRLNFTKTNIHPNYQSIKNYGYKYHPDGGFLKVLEERSWESLDCKWKYICTYCLFLARKSFDSSGGFRTSFCSYGFEDTDLGYQLQNMGDNFYYLDMPVYHFEPQKSKSEYGNSFFKKRRLMYHSAQTFYFSYLDERIYQELRWLWGANPFTGRTPAFNWLIDKLCILLITLGRPKRQVYTALLQRVRKSSAFQGLSRLRYKLRKPT